jgi:hypothetical protein
MDLKCPKCSSEETQKLTLVMDAGGVREKGSQLHLSTGANITVPTATVLFALVIGIPVAMASPLFGLLVVAGIVYGGYALRKKLKNTAKSQYADLSPEMKHNGFECKRCANLFIPA